MNWWGNDKNKKSHTKNGMKSFLFLISYVYANGILPMKKYVTISTCFKREGKVFGLLWEESNRLKVEKFLPEFLTIVLYGLFLRES